MPAQHRNGGMRHRDRTAMPCLDLSEEIESCGPCYVTSRRTLAPGGGVHALGNRIVHKLMVGGVIYHFIDAVPVTIMCSQNRLVRIGIKAPLDDLFMPGKCANVAQAPLSPASTLTLDAFNQGGVLCKNVVIDQWRCLVKNRVCTVLSSRSLFHCFHAVF